MAARRLIPVALLVGMAWAFVDACRTPGLPTAEHFALTGAHAAAPCESCHTVDLATPLPRACIDCHLPDRPAGHPEGDCAQCHNTTRWDDARFDHDTLAPDALCASCHEVDRPVPHAAGDCRACHNTTSWEDAAFSHDNLAPGTACESCHEVDRPSGHYAGDCRPCHLPTRWEDGVFDHGTLSAGTACTTCHLADRPAGHFDGDCAACHDTVDWQNGTFDHDPFFPLPHRGVSDCAECHPEPAGTTSFMCLNCHEHRRSEADAEHRGRPGYAYDSQRCLDCHPKGRE